MVDPQPRTALREPGPLLPGPLEGGAGVVPAGAGDDPPPQGRGQVEAGEELVDALALYVLELADALEVEVGHADLLPLVEEGGAPQGQQEGPQHLGALPPVLLTAEAGDGPGLVVVLQVQGVPGELLLPAQEGGEELPGPELLFQPLHLPLVALHVLKGKDQVQLVRPGEVPGLGGGDEDRLPHGEGVVFGQDGVE